MRTVASKRGPAVVVANGMESEPASEKDQALLARAPHLVLDGIALAAEAVGANEAHLCLPRTRDWLIDAVLAAVAERRRAGLDPVPLAVHDLPHHYVSSEETSLVHWLNGGEAKPTYTPPRPFERGVGKRPTLIDNVETLAHVALIARYGADWFREAGRADAAGTMLTTVSGAVAQPGVYEVEAGSSVGEMLAMAGADPAAPGRADRRLLRHVARDRRRGQPAVHGRWAAARWRRARRWCLVRAAAYGVRARRGCPDPAVPGQPERAAMRSVHLRAAGDRR